MVKNILILFLAFFLVSTVSAVTTLSTPSVCCEQTNEGGICINTQQSSCNNAFRSVPTSCESTSFCKLGTCYDSKEGMCMDNVPQAVCQANNGTWSDKDSSELQVCNLGCCIIEDQASFVTLTRCKSMATFFGVTPDFRTDIVTETACIEAANSQDEGACVFFEGNLKTCKFTTRKDCGGDESTLSVNTSAIETFSGKRFFKDVLCSAEELGTECARQVSTTCNDGKVYWQDSCGNKENVYSSDSEKSWNKGRVASPEEICAAVGGSKTCGNCDYLLGGRCGEWESTLGLGKPANVDHMCKATTCEDRDGKTRLNGESWCVYDGEVGNARDPAGSRHYREICVDGEVQVEACEDFRNQICIHSGIDSSAGEYSVAACRVNRWQDCTSQLKKDTCENTDQRDCIWVEAVEGVDFNANRSSSGQAFSNPTGGFSNPTNSNPSTTQNVASGLEATNSIGNAASAFTGGSSIGTVQPATLFFPLMPVTGFAINHVVGSGKGQWEQNSLNNKLRTNRTSNDTGLCVPMVSPGQKFWEQGDSQTVCAQASAFCKTNFTREKTRDILTGKSEYTDWKCTGNCECWGLEEGEEISNSELKSLEPTGDWAAKVNAVCSALGDCGADVNYNGVFTDDGYEWKSENKTYYITQADVGLFSNAKLGVGTGEVIKVDYLINDKYQLQEEDYVYIKG